MLEDNRSKECGNFIAKNEILPQLSWDYMGFRIKYYCL